METILLGERYELLEQIGEGGMSFVYKAIDKKLNRFVAVKILKKDFINNADIVEKFKKEATAIANLSDPNIVNVLDVGTQDQAHYIVMEYVKGSTLKEFIRDKGRLSYDLSINIAIQVARALDCAHKNNIIHRDIKPQNILVTEDGTIKVTDFGIAKSTNSSTIINTSNIIGSAHYFSPEQAKGNYIDSRTDLYSLGVVIYEMVTGRLPFDADSPVSVALKHIQEDVVPPKNINSTIPDSLNKLILKAMEKAQIKRYQSAKELIGDLEKIKNDPNVVIGSVPVNQDEFTRVMAPVNVPTTPKPTASKIANNDWEDDEEDEWDDEDEDENKSKKTKIRIILGLVFALILVAAGVGTYFITRNTNSNESITVPTGLVNSPKEDVQKKLEALGLVMDIGGEEKSDKPEGTVLSVTPNEGSAVKKNDHIRVIISGGVTKLKAPGLTTLNIEDAKKFLSNENIQLGNVTYEYSDSIPKDQVISQTPEAGTEMSQNNKIDLVVSKGPEIKNTNVPSLIGLSEADARNALTAAKLQVKVNYQDTDNQSEIGKVIASTHAEGISVKEGTQVTITVGRAPANQNGQG
ncbi:Stk1 family PASTA domain-containing Ser/Thr kinase [Clostridium sp. 'White wine YQ']|uniref:Stk1 family PASTA domain-containing Ser/Thr kinase n=1 Tax=Clostridium sp. 'White wine YQ' TaxID=3027474 RepID=UPI002365BA27|nr:Stk1 family PASTA domain-containing Ser/Thr kinase [Clostridium sp. 'White wine YQ']MDD7793745.1 Stk1 family PASTA domain-containing Ser/Thr kinase [Clostridium sp. 'White wine YQ']